MSIPLKAGSLSEEAAQPNIPKIKKEISDIFNMIDKMYTLEWKIPKSKNAILFVFLYVYNFKFVIFISIF